MLINIHLFYRIRVAECPIVEINDNLTLFFYILFGGFNYFFYLCTELIAIKTYGWNRYRENSGYCLFDALE